MTIQRPANSPATLTFRSPQGGALIDTPLTVEGGAYTSADYSEQVSDPKTTGAGEFTFYGQPGTVVTVTPNSPIGEAHEPIQFVGVVERPGGLTAVHPGDAGPVSEQVSEASLVGASIDGSLGNVRVHDAQTVTTTTTDTETADVVAEPPVQETSEAVEVAPEPSE